jgi:hypothetical protein
MTLHGARRPLDGTCTPPWCAGACVDPQRQRLEAGGWRNEAERPIYLVDIRGGYRCCWCLMEKGRLVLQPHPLSTSVPEAYRFPDEAEVVGQVVGVSMRLVAD